MFVTKNHFIHTSKRSLEFFYNEKIRCARLGNEMIQFGFYDMVVFRRGKPLFLSMRRYEKLRVDWILQNFDQPVVSPFSFEHLPVFLRDAHLVSNF